MIGADPAERNPTSDESSATVLDIGELRQHTDPRPQAQP
jgi:hypothetical protein